MIPFKRLGIKMQFKLTFILCRQTRLSCSVQKETIYKGGGPSVTNSS